MPKPKAVIFDLGKVLLDFDYSIAGRKIAARSNLSAADVQEFIDHSPLLCRFETGRIGKEQFFAEVQARTGFRGTSAEFSEFFADIFTRSEEHTSELQSRSDLVCRLLLEKKKKLIREHRYVSDEK